MKVTQVVIASLLKPVDDTRMYEKLGLSMAETNKYEVNIIGFESKNISSYSNIHFHPLKTFPRLSLVRVFKPFGVFKKYLQLKPSIIIVNTHDLLLVTMIYKILFGCKIIYDIRENYKANLLYTPVFPTYLRPLLSLWVRGKEWLTQPWINHYTLAEKAYARQLPFIGEKFTVIENKYQPIAKEDDKKRPVHPAGLNLLITGTLSASNGLFDAIKVTEALHHLDDRVKLKLVGRCALATDRTHLNEMMATRPYISIKGNTTLVPHEEIVQEIKKADFGLVFKRSNQGVNDDKILTRLYEYVALGLPMLMLPLPNWVTFCEKYNAALVVEPEQFDAQAILTQMTQNTFYTQGNISEILWENEAPKWLNVLEEISASRP